MSLYTSDSVMVDKVDKQTYISEFESHWVPNLFGPLCHIEAKSFVNFYSEVAVHIW